MFHLIVERPNNLDRKSASRIAEIKIQSRALNEAWRQLFPSSAFAGRQTITGLSFRRRGRAFVDGDCHRRKRPGQRAIAGITPQHLHAVLASSVLIRKNKFQPSGIFNFEPGGTVFSRVEGLAGANGMVGFAWNALREAFVG